MAGGSHSVQSSGTSAISSGKNVPLLGTKTSNFAEPGFVRNSGRPVGL